MTNVFAKKHPWKCIACRLLRDGDGNKMPETPRNNCATLLCFCLIDVRTGLSHPNLVNVLGIVKGDALWGDPGRFAVARGELSSESSTGWTQELCHFGAVYWGEPTGRALSAERPSAQEKDPCFRRSAKGEFFEVKGLKILNKIPSRYLTDTLKIH